MPPAPIDILCSDSEDDVIVLDRYRRSPRASPPVDLIQQAIHRNPIISLEDLEETEEEVVDVTQDSPRRGVSRRDRNLNQPITSSSSPYFYMLLLESARASWDSQSSRPRRARRDSLFTTSNTVHDLERSVRGDPTTFLKFMAVERVKNAAHAQELGACPICLCEYKPRMALRKMPGTCGHLIHKTCFDAWLHKVGDFKCPLDNTLLPVPRRCNDGQC